MMKNTFCNKRFIILGAGKNKAWNENPSLAGIDRNRTFLNWQLETARILGCDWIDYIAGYHLDHVSRILPNSVNIIYNPLWNETGPLYSLLLSNFNDTEDLYISYNDIIVDDEFVTQCFSAHPNNHISCFIDSSYSQKGENTVYSCETIRDPHGQTGEFIGFIKIPSSFIPLLKTFKVQDEGLKTKFLSDFMKDLIGQGIPLEFVNAENHWCDINVPEKRAKFILKGKARSLANLKKITQHSQFLDQTHFRAQDWESNQPTIIESIQKNIKSELIVVRSSACNEDGFLTSQAGAFKSELGVPLHCQETLSKAVQNIIHSYNDSNPDNLILVQPYVNNAYLHGVVFTQTHEGGPYYIFNYHYGKDTQAITNGTSSNHQTVYIYENTPISEIPPDLIKAFAAVKEIEALLHYHALDIEFVINDRGDCFILQVRPQVSHKNYAVNNKASITKALAEIASRLEFYESTKPNEFTDIPSIWAVMPDWNPAEIIGRKPNILSLSLYQELVTDQIWAIQRAQFGYKDLGSYPLMKNFYGLPYIDVKASFRSFIPNSLDEDLSKKVVALALEHLRCNPHLHDKVEFEVMPTCYRFDFKEQFNHITRSLTQKESEELVNHYKAITLKALSFDSGRQGYTPLPFSKSGAAIEEAVRTIHHCKQGVLAFAHEARKAFIATNLLKSMVAVGAICEEELGNFYGSIDTISRQISKDAYDCKQGKMSRSSFVQQYGHLRPGTYDITSPRYDVNPEIFLDPMIESALKEDLFSFKWSFEAKRNIEYYLKTMGQDISIEAFTHFARDAIKAREMVKFSFTKDLSAALEYIARFGDQLGLSREEMAFVDYPFLMLLNQGVYPHSNTQILQHLMNVNRDICAVRAALEMPVLFSSIKELNCFYYPNTMPNYITREKVVGEVIHLKKNFDDSLADKIVFIENADPGYDWIFSKKIKGFVTMYGGVNSHMAVRAAEYNIPAVVGIGEKLYKKFCDVGLVAIDCHSKTIQVLS